MKQARTPVKPVQYPLVPDLSITVGDKVRSFDFRDNAQCYFVGTVESITELGQYKIKVEYQVWEDQRVPDDQNYCSYVVPPVNGTQGIFGLLNGVQRILPGEL
jgi:hypothetical protein